MAIHSASELQLHEEVGRGAFGVVYRGVTRDQQQVAVKQIDLEHELASLADINREIQILADCRLEQITRYLGAFVLNYQLWVVMEYVDGGLLFELLRPGPVDDATAGLVAHEMLVALRYLHGQGKIHRDLKSHNVLVSSRGQVKLTDFGVSAQLALSFSRRNTTVGTPYWMAPEVVVGHGHGTKADIWSLGCCVYELKTQKPPLQELMPPMRALRALLCCAADDDFLGLLHLPAGWEHLLRACFAIDPQKRPSAGRLLRCAPVLSPDPQTKRAVLAALVARKRRWDHDNHVPTTQRFYGAAQGDVDTTGVAFDFSSLESDRDDVEADTSSELKRDFAAALEAAAQRMGPTAQQKETIATVNSLLASLCEPARALGRVPVGHYLQCVLEEIEKTPHLHCILHGKTHAHTAMDDIEHRLLESWLEKRTSPAGQAR